MATWVDFKTIKEKVGMESILDHYGLLEGMKRKDKTNALVGACPIHKGTNRFQFHISLAKNNFNCFGDCHGGGNVLDFVAKMEKVDIRTAALKIQEWFGIEAKRSKDKPPKENLQAKENSPELPKEKKEDPKETEATKYPGKINQPLKFTLQNLDFGYSYLKERGLNQETIECFGVGFCAKGLMKDRIAIPVQDENGKLVAYIGRWAGKGEPPEGEGKYKIPPNFHKSLVVFNLHRAKDLAKENGLILVEGFFGCLRVWQAGFKSAVALMGSSLSEEQETLVVKAVGSQGRVVLMFDGDKAGQECRDDVLSRLITKVYVKVVNLPEGGQPDGLSNEGIKELLG